MWLRSGICCVTGLYKITYGIGCGMCAGTTLPTARLRYKETGRSLENGGCTGDPHIVVDRCVVFLCILHCCMAIGRLQVAFIDTRLVDLPKENADAVQRVLYRARTGVKLGASAAPDGGGPCVVPRVGGTWSVVGLRPGGC